MRVYPDVYVRRFAWMLADLIMAGWVTLCVLAGRFVNHLVLQLDVLAQGLINAGRTLNSWILSFRQGIPTGVPYLTDFLRHTADAFQQHSGEPLVSAGQAGSRGIHQLALILGIMVAAVPLALALLIYLPRRIRLITDMQGVHVTIRRALAKPELTPQMLEILAGRAIYTLPYHRLLRYSRNPAEDWYARRFEPLARAELEQHGLSVERYFRARPALGA
jgi:hypothetical protein